MTDKKDELSSLLDRAFQIGVIVQNEGIKDRLSALISAQSEASETQQQQNVDIEQQRQFQANVKEMVFETKKQVDLAVSVKERDSLLGLAAFKEIEYTFTDLDFNFEYMEKLLEDLRDKEFVYEVKKKYESEFADAQAKSGAEFENILNLIDELNEKKDDTERFKSEVLAHLNRLAQEVKSNPCRTIAEMKQLTSCYRSFIDVIESNEDIIDGSDALIRPLLTKKTDEAHYIVDQLTKDKTGHAWHCQQLGDEIAEVNRKIRDAKSIVGIKFLPPKSLTKPVKPASASINRPLLIRLIPLYLLPIAVQILIAVILEVLCIIVIHRLDGDYFYGLSSFALIFFLLKANWEYKSKIDAHAKLLDEYNKECIKRQKLFESESTEYKANLKTQEEMTLNLPLIEDKLKVLMDDKNTYQPKLDEVLRGLISVKSSIDLLNYKICELFNSKHEKMEHNIKEMRLQLDDIGEKHPGIFSYIENAGLRTIE